MNARPLPSKPLGLQELADLLRSHLRSAWLVDAHAEEGRFVLRLAGPDRPYDREVALGEIDKLLNSRQVYTFNGAGIEVRFEPGAASVA